VSKFRSVCRFLHREFGFLAVGLTLAYAISGVAVNHVDSWNPSYEQTVDRRTIEAPGTGPTEEVAPVVIERLALAEPVRNIWRASDEDLRLIVESGTIDVNLTTGEAVAVQVAPRPLLRDVNFLHLNQGKGAWTWIADAYAVVLAILAVTVIMLVKGRRGLAGRGGVLLTLGVLLPVVYVVFAKYL